MQIIIKLGLKLVKTSPKLYATFPRDTLRIFSLYRTPNYIPPSKFESLPNAIIIVIFEWLSSWTENIVAKWMLSTHYSHFNQREGGIRDWLLSRINWHFRVILWALISSSNCLSFVAFPEFICPFKCEWFISCSHLSPLEQVHGLGTCMYVCRSFCLNRTGLCGMLAWAEKGHLIRIHSNWTAINSLLPFSIICLPSWLS